MQFEQAIKIMAQPEDSTHDNAANGVANGKASGAPGAESGLPSVSQLAGMLDDHKGKLAIGVAATLGLMVFYSWREKRLAKEDPEAHALHQRSKAIVKAAETDAGRLQDDTADAQAAARARHGERGVLPR